MARIAGVDLPKNKRVQIGLTFTALVRVQQIRFWQEPALIRIPVSRI